MADVRLLRPGPVPLDAATASIDALVASLDTEMVPLHEAGGRVLAEDIRAAAPIPREDRAALDGFAVRAEASLGAGAYSPLALPLVAVAAGAELPPGTDAVVPLAAAELEGIDRIAVVEPVAAGAHVERCGTSATSGSLITAAGTRLTPRHIGLIAAADIAAVPVARRPRVAIVLVGPRPASGTTGGNSPMLHVAVARDGGVAAGAATAGRARSALVAALAAASADFVLVVGGTGPGSDDHAGAALGEIGEIVFHGVALFPGETAGLGRRAADGVPVMLLPGTPSACLWSYELLAGRAIRRLARGNPALPYCSRPVQVARKIVSAIGTTEICPVQRGPDGTIEPLPGFAEIGLRAATAAAGFVIIPEAREGHAPGEIVTAYFYDQF
jgi:molybdopterin molybdotransferase